MKVFFVLLEAVVKVLIGLMAGGGAGLLAFGALLMQVGVTDFSGPGPPPVPVMIGAGSGLLAATLMLLILFVGPFARRRWFGSAEKSDEVGAGPSS